MAGEERSGRAWTGRHGNAGMERPVEIWPDKLRQEWSGEFVVARSGLARQVGQGLIGKGQVRSGNAGGERCDQERRDGWS
tara:strand:+ start:1203 stop:1442 length:240 start_codon:yes stop_codon:yes gene_type:complete